LGRVQRPETHLSLSSFSFSPQAAGAKAPAAFFFSAPSPARTATDGHRPRPDLQAPDAPAEKNSVSATVSLDRSQFAPRK